MPQRNRNPKCVTPRQHWYRAAYRQGALQLLTIIVILAITINGWWLAAAPVAVLYGIGIGWLVREHQERKWERAVW